MKSYYSYWEIIVSWQTKDVQKLNCVTSTRNLYASHIISCAFNFYFITFLRRTTFLFSFYFFCIHSIHKYFMVNKVKWFSFYFILYMSPFTLFLLLLLSTWTERMFIFARYFTKWFCVKMDKKKWLLFSSFVLSFVLLKYW